MEAQFVLIKEQLVQRDADVRSLLLENNMLRAELLRLQDQGSYSCSLQSNKVRLNKTIPKILTNSEVPIITEPPSINVSSQKPTESLMSYPRPILIGNLAE